MTRGPHSQLDNWGWLDLYMKDRGPLFLKLS